jgi:membrane-bound serine protease (ClpP class)
MAYRVLLLILAASVFVRGEILRVEVDGVIEPITAEFIQDAVQEAADSDAEFLLIRLATPGGLGISMQEIVQGILNSKVPVVCYVGPKGSHAASAGFFILLSADVAVMAPGTNTGAAHPVFPFGMENETMMEKVKNDSLASLRSFVVQRKRNYELAEKAVLESKSYTADEALEGQLIDLIAEDEGELLSHLEGFKVSRFDGEEVVLRTEGRLTRTLEMTFRQSVLSAIANPNLALILGLIGLLGLYLEFTHPGLIAPGVVGGICLLLGLVGFSLLPVNYVGVLLIVLGIGLFVAEVLVQGFGVLGIGGVVSLVLGLLFLVDSPYPELRIGWGVALAVAIPFAAVCLFFLWVVARNRTSRVVTGREGLVGLTGVARSGISRKGGKVFVAGEWWNAVSEEDIAPGSRVRVRDVNGLTVLVTAESEEGLWVDPKLNI